MISDSTVKECLETLERQLRLADEAVTKSPVGQKGYHIRRRNAINAACNDLFRFGRILP